MSKLETRLAKLENRINPPDRTRIYILYPDGTTSDGKPHDPDASTVTLTIGGLDLQHDI